MSSLDVELSCDRLLSASTPTDCLTSLEQLQSQCKYNRPKSTSTSTTSTGGGDPKKQRPSQQEQNDKDALQQAERDEKERQSAAIDTLLNNTLVLNALCSLIASCTLPSQHGGSNGMEVVGGDIAACELLLVILPPTSTS